VATDALRISIGTEPTSDIGDHVDTAESETNSCDLQTLAGFSIETPGHVGDAAV
jgi:hypothetical protein